MSEPGSVLDAQVNALEHVVESHREERCQALIDDATSRARETVGQSHQDNRARMRAAIEQERRHMEEALAATRARLATRERERQQQADKARLERAWSRLGDALVERWLDPDSRRTWLATLFEEALARLPGERWRVEHPPGFDPAEMAEMVERVTGHCGGASPDFVALDHIGVGVRICADGVSLDGTRDGLLADRPRVESELLASIRVHDVDGGPT